MNEAFAAVVKRLTQKTGVADEKVNVNGGSIAMSHPLGAAGALMLRTLLGDLQRHHLNRGTIKHCFSGGMGIDSIIGPV